jgi:hypothetical protein
MAIPDHGDESNLNRTLTLTEADIPAGTRKVEAARRRILEINPRANVEAHACRWQDRPKALDGSTLVMGCVDSLSERQQIETCCRRLLVPYIDIGIDVHAGDPPPMSGQIILSAPGGPCMLCLHFLTDEKIGREAANYGAAGGRPQVVWGNGVTSATYRKGTGARLRMSASSRPGSSSGSPPGPARRSTCPSGW